MELKKRKHFLTFYEASITLIPKPDKDKNEKEHISVLN